MTTRTFLYLALIVCCFASVGFAQDVPPPPAAPDVGPALSAPPGASPAGAPYAPGQYAAPPSGYAPPGGYAPQGPVYQPQPGPNDVPPGAYGPPPGPVMVMPAQPYPYPYGPRGLRPLVLVPAPPLASQQWSVAIDALFLERSSGGGIPLGYSVYNAASGLPPQVPTDNLYSDDALFPLEAGVRLEISHQFTDYFSVSATYWGLQQWSVGNTIYGNPNNDTVLAFSPYLQLPALLLGLDNSLSYTYASQVENVEVNASFRLNSDSSYWHLDWLWGARFINLSDQFTLTGIDSLNSTEEDLKYTTSNNLVGVQTGLQFVHGWGRFQWETGVKAGLMVNMYKQHGSDTASDPGGVPAGFVPGDASASGSSLAGLFEVSVAARMRITDELWLRLGYQFYDITGVALAPRQLNGFGHGGNVALDGLSIGLLYGWQALESRLEPGGFPAIRRW